MPKMELTQKEYSCLEESLEMESLCLAKYDFYADTCNDPEIRDLIGSIVDNKRQHMRMVKRIIKPRTSYTGTIKYQ